MTSLTFEEIIKTIQKEMELNPNEWKDYNQFVVEDFLYATQGPGWVDVVQASPEHIGSEAIDTVLDYLELN